MHLLITGSAGFIGSALSWRLLARGDRVIGVDDFNDTTDPELKEARTARSREFDQFVDVRVDISERKLLGRIFAEHRPDVVINLAALAGYRHSVEHPAACVEANLVGFGNILEACHQHGVRHLIYASSSSVYGGNTRRPFVESDPAERPLSLYAATKKANELMAYAYGNMFGLPSTGLRLFTVYGPWGRPDMALFQFAGKILRGEPINLYNHGRHRRDFTYIDDIVTGILAVLEHAASTSMAAPGEVASQPPARVYNLGNQTSVELNYFLELIEQHLGRPAIRNLLPAQPGDMLETCANASSFARTFAFTPQTPLEVGLPQALDWYLAYAGAD